MINDLIKLSKKLEESGLLEDADSIYNILEDNFKEEGNQVVLDLMEAGFDRESAEHMLSKAKQAINEEEENEY